MGEVFHDHIEVRQFLCGHNKRVENWITQNWSQVEGLNGPVDAARISRALSGQPVAAPIVRALEKLHEDMRGDPWSWCKPPDVDDLGNDWRPLRWWHETLQPAIPLSRFERIKQFPLRSDEREIVVARLDAWASRLREACDRFQEDTRLVRAVQADISPEFQHWIDEDDLRLVDEQTFERWTGKKLRRRVGDRGLHDCTAEEVGQAFALVDATRPLPLVQEARLAYARPRAIPEHDHLSEPVEPWNGEEFEGVEIKEAVIKSPQYTGYTERRVKGRHRVCYWWDGQRYQVEDVQKFAQVFDGQWREPTRDEKDLLETGMKCTKLTRQEMLDQREAWIDNLVAEYESDGIRRTREEVEEQFETVLSQHDAQSDEAAADERREIARRRIEFKRSLRRRPV